MVDHKSARIRPFSHIIVCVIIIFFKGSSVRIVEIGTVFFQFLRREDHFQVAKIFKLCIFFKYFRVSHNGIDRADLHHGQHLLPIGDGIL